MLALCGYLISVFFEGVSLQCEMIVLRYTWCVVALASQLEDIGCIFHAQCVHLHGLFCFIVNIKGDCSKRECVYAVCCLEYAAGLSIAIGLRV